MGDEQFSVDRYPLFLMAKNSNAFDNY